MNRDQRMIIILICLIIALCFVLIRVQLSTNSIIENHNICVNELNEYKETYDYKTIGGKQNDEDKIFVWQEKNK